MASIVDYLHALFTPLGGTVTSVVVLGNLLTWLITHHFTKATERYKRDLTIELNEHNAKLQKEIKEFEITLNRIASEEKSRLDRMFPETIVAIRELRKASRQLKGAFSSVVLATEYFYLHPKSPTPAIINDLRQKEVALTKGIEEFEELIEEHSTYISDESTALMRKLASNGKIPTYMRADVTNRQSSFLNQLQDMESTLVETLEIIEREIKKELAPSQSLLLANQRKGELNRLHD